MFSIISLQAEVPKCTYCHVDNQEALVNFTNESKVSSDPKLQVNCALCHVNLFMTQKQKKSFTWSSHQGNSNLNKIDENYLFSKNSSLVFVVEGQNRFTDCGLKTFLTTPVPRRFNTLISMFPMDLADVEEMIKSKNIKLETCPDKGTEKASLLAGEKIFKANCLSCHSEDSKSTIKGPRLRLGYPLLSFKYFSYRVKNGFQKTSSNDFIYQYYWKEKKTQFLKNKMETRFLMPSFSHLSDIDVENLYQYINDSKEDLESIKIKEDVLSFITDPADLFMDVQNNIFSTSCRHCHGHSSHGSNFIKDVLGFKKHVKGDLIQFPIEAQNLKPSEKLSQLLSPSEKCGPSPLVNLLWERHLEVKGTKSLNRAGMPINLPPIPVNTINHLREWGKIGCPSPNGWLCKGCK